MPLISSETIKLNYEKMISKRYINKGYWVTTGGTGRNPTPIFLSNESFGIEWAFMVNQWKRIGFNWKDKKITFRGKNLGDKLVKPVYPYNELLVNVFKLTESNIMEITEEILKFDARFFHGYLSAIYLFTKLLGSRNIEGSVFNLKGILLGSENIDEEKRRLVEQYFNTKTYSWYGHTEKGILAGECEINRSYHAFYQYGFFDLLNENGSWTNSGEIITTGFVNKAMPLINYKTGDYAIKDKEKCECGRNYTLIKKVIGRWGNDFVYDKNQNKVSTTALNIHIENQKDILNLQIIQKHLGEVEIAFSLIKIDNKKQIEEAIKKEFSSKLGENFIVKTRLVEDNEIYRTKTGKVPYLVSYIKEN
jgi:phenylacetate-CoA ligase